MRRTRSADPGTRPPRGQRAGAVLVVALVVLAGCNALGASGGDGDETPLPVTPAPVGTTPAGTAAGPGTGTGSPVPAAVAGVLEGGTVDLGALAASHVRYLSNTSFTYVASDRRVGGTGEFDSVDRGRVVVENASAYLERVNESAYPGVHTVYVAPNARYRRVVPPDSPPVVGTGGEVYADPQGQFAREVAGEVRRRLVVGAVDAGLVDREGRRYLRLFSRTPPVDFGDIYGDYEVRNYTATVWVAPEGYVRTFHYRFELVAPTERVVVRKRYGYRAVGETTLPRPDWVRSLEDDRRDASATSTSTPSRDGTDDGSRDGTDDRTTTGTPYGTDNGTETGPRRRPPPEPPT